MDVCVLVRKKATSWCMINPPGISNVYRLRMCPILAGEIQRFLLHNVLTNPVLFSNKLDTNVRNRKVRLSKGEAGESPLFLLSFLPTNIYLPLISSHILLWIKVFRIGLYMHTILWWTFYKRIKCPKKVHGATETWIICKHAMTVLYGLEIH